MVEASLVAASAFAEASGLLYLFVGWAVQDRAVGREHRRANDLFALWWWGLAALSILGGIVSLAAALGFRDVAAFSVFTAVALLLLCIALLGLLSYLLYLFTGRNGLLLPLAVGYGAFYVAMLALLAAAGPDGVEVTHWGAKLTFARPIAPAFAAALGVGLLLPQALCALAYLRLARRLEDRAQRHRVEMVAVSIFLWFLSSLFASAAGLGQSDAWQVLSRCISLAAALTILGAYRPTPWMQRHWGLQAVPRRAG